MELLIVRHAISMERDAQRWPDDALRPLSPVGSKRGRKAATGLAKLAEAPTVVLCSPLIRARQTARILERRARWPQAELSTELAPEAQPGALLARLGASAEERIGLVGHEPHLGKLLAECLGTRPARGFALRKMGVALVRFPSRARKGHGQLVWLATPRVLRAVRRP